MEPFPNSEEWKEFRRQTEVKLQLDDKVEMDNLFYKGSQISYQGPQKSETNSSEEDEEGKPKCNMWKGQNYDLHLIGHFENEFQKRVKMFQVPPTVPVSLDPFCRAEFPSDPPNGDAYLIWKGKDFPAKDHVKSEKAKVPSYCLSVSDDEGTCDSDGESDTDPDISEYIAAQRWKKAQGQSLTGETIMYDDEYDVIRNIHADSISMTNYGILGDEKNFGKAELLFDQLLPQEKLMLRAAKSSSTCIITPLIAKNAEDDGKDNAGREDVHVSLAGGGDN